MLYSGIRELKQRLSLYNISESYLSVFSDFSSFVFLSSYRLRIFEIVLMFLVNFFSNLSSSVDMII